MTLDLNPTGLDDILAANDAPRPRRKRSLTEFLLALDCGGDTSGFYLDDFEEHERGHIARRFGLTFLDGSPYAPPAALPGIPPSPPEQEQPACAKQRAPTAPGRETRGGKAPAPEPEKPTPNVPFGGFALPPDKLPPYQNNNAFFLDLRITPANPAAEALVGDLVGRLLEAERRLGKRQRKRRETVERQFREAVGAIAGNLLRAWGEDPPVAVHRSRDVNALAEEGASWRSILGTIDAMKALGLLLHRRGGKAMDRPDGWAARYWPGVPLLRAAVEHGLDPATVGTAFRRQRAPASTKAPKVREPLRLKEFKQNPNGRAPRRAINFSDPVAAALRAEVEAMNAFAAIVPVKGCRPPRWFRQFNGNFRLYGRLHAVGNGNYQAMKLSERLAKIRIQGEPVVEIDIHASLLSVLHGQLRLPLPTGDMYAMPGIPRAVVKEWVNATLGKGTPVVKWSRGTPLGKPILEEHPAPMVMAAAVARYPFLAEPALAAEEFRRIADPKRALIHMLMGVESDIILDTLKALRGDGVLALPMHDGLIVPASAEGLACGLMRAAGVQVADVALVLKVDRPPP